MLYKRILGIVVILLVFNRTNVWAQTTNVQNDSTKQNNIENVGKDTNTTAGKNRDASFDYNDFDKGMQKFNDDKFKALNKKKVIVKVKINADGRPSNPSIMSSEAESINEAAIKAVMEFKDYKPAIKDDKPIAQWISIPLMFKFPE